MPRLRRLPEAELTPFALARDGHCVTSSSPKAIEPASGGEPPGGGEGVGTGPEVGVSAEAAGEEVAGLIGTRYYVKPNFFLSLGVVYDNNNAVLFRPGVTYTFNLLQ